MHTYYADVVDEYRSGVFKLGLWVGSSVCFCVDFSAQTLLKRLLVELRIPVTSGGSRIMPLFYLVQLDK